jgi:hypothetical protein
MNGPLSAGKRSIRRHGLYKTLQKSALYLFHSVLEHSLKHLQPQINSRYIVNNDNLRPISNKFQRLKIGLETNISSNVVEGTMNINPNIDGRNIIQNYDPLPLRDPYVCEIPNVILIGKYPVGISQDRMILGDTIFHSFDGNYRLAATLSNILDPVDYFTLFENTLNKKGTYLNHIDRGIVLTSRWNHYGHWVLEHALKLRFLEEYLGSAESNPAFILEPDPPDWKLRYLSLMGYEDIDVVKYDNPMYLENIVLPSYPEPTSDSFQWLRDRVRNNVDSEVFNSVDSPDRIWLSRQNQSNRRITNSEEIFQLVRDFGFEVVCPETMSIDEQIAYFSEVDILAGPHGSAFTNMVYSTNMNVSVLELFGKRTPPGFFRLANILDFNYSYVLCKPDDDDMYVDTNKITEILTKIS